MIASLKSALYDALSLARLLREAAARVKAAEARAEQSERLFRILAVEHARTLAARQDDRRRHEAELAEEHEQAQRAIRDRDAAEVQRDAWRLKAEEWRRAAEEATAMHHMKQREELRARLLETRAALDSAEALARGLERDVAKLNAEGVRMGLELRKVERELHAAREERDSAQRVAEHRMAALEEVRRQRDAYRDERDAARGSLASALADIAEARKLAGALPSDTPQEMVGRLIEQWDALRSQYRTDTTALRAESERLSAELRTLKARGGGRS